MSLNVEICNISKRVRVFVPFTEDTYRNVEIFRAGVEHVLTYINKVFANLDYHIEIYYESK